MHHLKLSLLFVFAILPFASIANADFFTYTKPIYRQYGTTTHMDSTVRSGASADTNYGTSLYGHIGPLGTGEARRTYVGYDLSMLPDNVTIDDVYLSITIKEVIAGCGSSPVTYELYETGEFLENTITWNNAPAMDTLLGSLDVAPASVTVGQKLNFRSEALFAATEAAYAAKDEEMFYVAMKAQQDDESAARNILGIYTFDVAATGSNASKAPCLMLTLTAEYVRGDANYSGTVDETDAAILANNWLCSGDGIGWDQGDFNGDGVVDGIDATYVAANWQGDVPEESVPEPSVVLLLLAAVALAPVLLLRRRR